MTRRKLKKLILKEVKLIKEGSVSNLIVEMGEVIEQHMIATGRNQLSVREALRIIRVQIPSTASFDQRGLEDFFIDSLVEGFMDFAELSYDIVTTATGREIEVVTRYVDDEDEDIGEY